MITTLVLLATLFLLEARMSLAFSATPLTHIQLNIIQFLQIFSLHVSCQPLCPKCVVMDGVVLTKVKDLAFCLAEVHTIGLSPAIQPVQIPLQGLPTPRQMDTFSQLDVICKLTEGALNALIQIINKDIEQDRPQYQPLRNTTCDCLPVGFNSIHHHFLGQLFAG